MSDELISLREAAKQNIATLRRPNWSDPADHVKITIADGLLGPWIELWSPMNERINGRNPVKQFLSGADIKEWLPWRPQ